MRTIRIGSGAGYGGDRIEPAVAVMEKGAIQYIIFECLAERTIALAQEQKSRHPEQGYNQWLSHRMRRILPLCAEKKIKVITNMGAANPVAAVQVVKHLALSLGITSLKLAAVLGDDIFPQIERYLAFPIMETGQKLETLQPFLVSANAYLGGWLIRRWFWVRCSLSLTGTRTIMNSWEKERSPVICWNAERRSPGAILLILGIRTYRIWPTWASRSRKSPQMGM